MALTVVIIGSVIASFLAVNTMLNELSPQEGTQNMPITEREDITWDEPIADVEVKEDDVPIKPYDTASQSTSETAQAQESTSQEQLAQPTQPSAVSSLPSSQSSQSGELSQSEEPAQLQEVQTNSYTWPVQGSILQAYSGDELVFNETMGDWRTHNGTDIKAELGATVTSPGAFTVISTSKDGEWGTVVELEKGDTVIKICGLTDVSIKAGDNLAQGTPVGKVTQFPAEMALEPHVHVEVMKNGEYVNPEDVLTNGVPVA